MAEHLIKRIIADTTLLFGILFAPMWATALLALLLLFYFPRYYEFIIAGFLLDILYGAPSAWILHIPYTFGLSATILYFLGNVLKKRLRIYDTIS